ncbi:MAG: sulfatase-like hydrolase/transferase, partial [Pseudomonadales bacterium]
MPDRSAPRALKNWSVVAMTLLCFWHSSLAQSSRPNIVLILADDLGFTDIAPYGSEIKTPSLSALAEKGIRFTNYHTAASCAPSRGMLLTGVDSHRNGVPNIPEALPPEQRRNENYRGTLGHNVVTVATLLQDSGYHTYMAGKWHLGKTPDLLPSNRGFERTVAMADTGSDNWEQKPYIPIYKKANWYADGEETQLPEDFYSSRFLIDKTIEFIDSNRDDGQPFFAYIPFQAVHNPVQAPQEFIDKYMGVYDEGWEALRQQRHANAIKLGIVPATSGMEGMATTGDWNALTAKQKRYQAKRMAVYAGMVEAMDYHIGRLMKHLKSTGQYDNTVFIFTSDNGSEPTGPE